MNPRVVHDVAWETANAIMGAFEPVFLPGEAKDAHEIIYDRVKDAIETACRRQQEERRRLSPRKK